MADEATFPIEGDAEDPARESGQVDETGTVDGRPAPVDQIGDAGARDADGSSPQETSVPHDAS